MSKIFYKNKGTISVFLSLILLPTLVVGGITVDASRIYMSKVVISDAGEMAMNAGLAQYNEKLHDEYGLLVMDNSPEAMQSDLEAYFNGSLNGTGLPGAEDYDRILDLLTKSFEALNVAGSEIYQTEVEKQQILEYMKYRAPVCLTELVVDKINQLKDTKKMTEAMEAEMDFSEAMEDCQDAFEKAKDALDQLDRAAESFPDSQTIKGELENTEKDYKEIVAKCLLMRAAIQKYDKKSTSTDLKEMVELFIDSAKKVDLTNPYSSSAFDKYISSMYYKNTVDALGGVEKLQQLNEGEQEAGTDAEESEEEDTTGGKNQKDLEELIKSYETQKERISGYLTILLSTANDTVSGHSNMLNHYLETSKAAEQAAKTAYDKLKDVKSKLEKAAETFSVWDDKTDELKAVGKSGNMDEEVEEYRNFFSGDGKDNLEELEKLMSDVQENQNYFDEWEGILEQEKFFGQSIAKVQPVSQMEKYNEEAKKAVKDVEAKYSSVDRARGTYTTNYEHIGAGTAHNLKSIHNNPFYVKLQKYCDSQNERDSQNEQSEANGKIDQSKTASEEAVKEEGYPTFNWASVRITLPSSQVGTSASTVKDDLTNLNVTGNVKNKSARRDVVSKFKESIKAANSFLDAVDRIVEDGIENLYISEYAMQMFSHYTVGMKDGSARPDGEIIGISGYALKEHKAYRAECEYILWGKEGSQENIRNTVMMIFGIRLLFNSFYAFTDAVIGATAKTMALAITGAAPYLAPIVEVVIKLGYAGVETANDVTKLKQGYGVTIFKDSSTWATGGGDNTKGITFDYSEYLRVFLNISMLAGNEAGILGRIADCIQVNEPDIDLLTGYTMISVQAKVSSRTTFMRKASDWGESGVWGFPDNSYTIFYQSILGY